MSSTLDLKRFGHVQLTSAPNRQFVVLVSLFEGRGITPFLRLMPFAVNTDGQRSEEIEGKLLHAFAIGSVEAGSLAITNRLPELVEKAQALADTARLEEERQIQVRDASVIAARMASLKRSTEIKVRSTEKRLAAASEPKIRRMHEGRIRNLTTDLELKLQQLDVTKSMVSSQPIAVLVVDA